MRRIATALWLAAALVALWIPASAGAVFGFDSTFGGTGAGNGKFSHPQSADVDSMGAVYVADTGNARVEKFDAAGNFASALTTTGVFSPQDVAVDGLGNVYASSPHRVVVWNAFGVQIGDWVPAGTAYGIAVDGSGNVYVSDVLNSSIHKYNGAGIPDPTTPTFGGGHVLQPQGLTTSSGNVYVADPSNASIEKFKSDGTFLDSFPMPSYTVYANGSTFAGVVRPQDVAVGGAGGRIFAPDTGIHSNLVVVLSSSGQLQQVFGAPDSDPSNACAVRSPWGLATSPSGALYVVSTGEDRIRVFKETGTACPSPNFGAPPPIGGGGSLPGGVSPAAVAADHTKPSVRITGLPRRCARRDFVFVVNVADDVLVSRIALFVQKRRAASQEVDQQQFFFRVRIPVNNVRRQIPRGFIYRVLLAVKATDLAGHTTKVKRKFGICGAG
ncbi:MAG: hypothetical protein ACJ75Z_13725 [Solirubrobacterales bacterium]